MDRKERRKQKTQTDSGKSSISPVSSGLFQEAFQHHQNGRLAEAEQLYRQVLMIEPEHVEALHSLGVLSRQVGRPDVAVELIQRAIELRNDVPAFYNNLGTALQDQKKFSEALTQYERAVAINPAYAGAYVNMGNTYRDQGRLEDAVLHYRRAISLDSKFAEAHNSLGVVLKAQSKLTEAVSHYEHAVAIKPNYLDAYNNMGNALKELWKLDEAVQVYKRAIVLNPNFADAHNGLGNVLHAQGNLTEAVWHYEHAIVLNPNFADAHNGLGNVLYAQDNLTEAVSHYERAIALNPNLAEAHNALRSATSGLLLLEAVRRRQAGRLIEAEQLCRQVLAVEPAHADALHLFGVLAHQAGHPDVAVDYIGKAIRLKDDVPEFYNNLGTALQAQGDLDEALEQYERALAIKPDFLEAYNNMGNILKEQWKLEEAIKVHKHAIVLNPNFANAYNSLGNALHAQGNLTEAVSHYERAIALNPNLAEAHNGLGIALYAQGKITEAVSHHERAIAIKPDFAAARLNYGLMCLLSGNFQEGWRLHESRWTRKDFKGPLWDGGTLCGKTLLLHCEQGLGDSIQFIRYAAMIDKADGRILLVCPPSLGRLFKDIDGVDEIFSDANELPAYDFRAPLMSLPGLLKTRLETIPASVPYLHTEPELAAVWRERLQVYPGLKVGVVWRGNPAHKNDRNRSMTPSQFAEFLDLPEISVINLQKDAKPEEIAALGIKGPFLDAAPDLNGFSDTAALIANLDLVISVDTSVCHLAGALGAPVWTLIPYAPDWRWLLEREDTPWYPTMRLFRQPKIGDWPSVIKTVRSTLQRLIKGDREALKPEVLASPNVIASGEQEQPAAQNITEVNRRRKTIDSGHTDFERWTGEKQLEQAWDGRAQRAADYIPAGAVVLDLGCGRMALEGFLPKECRYVPCDVARRDERTVICDFNTGNYPDAEAQSADLITFLGVMEYIFDAKTFLSHLRKWRHPVVMSYCTTEGIRDRERRRGLGWVNDFSYDELVTLLKEVGFAVQRADRIDNVQWLFRLQPNTPVLPAVKRVAVLSYYNVGNFGDRLGYHLINDILPAHAEVTNLSFRPWTLSDETYDLLVVGIGNSLFGPMLNDSLISLVDRSRSSIGIFGTQYHESTPRPMLNALVGRLDHWYTRYQDDVFRYGRDLENVSHLGDWLIRAFPMTRPTTTERLDIGNEILDDLPLDRTIQNIQRHSTVFSTRLHPLLCALTSADKVGYREQREVKGLISGKFRSLLLDVFGRTFPEEELWSVDRGQVLAYKSAVETRILDLRARIHRILNTP